MDPETVEVGVNLMRSAWGQRLGQEALLAVLAHGFDTLDLLVIGAGHGVAHDNSRKLLERVGFKYTHTTSSGVRKRSRCAYGRSLPRAGTRRIDPHNGLVTTMVHRMAREPASTVPTGCRAVGDLGAPL